MQRERRERQLARHWGVVAQPPVLRSALRIPAAHHRLIMVPSRHRFTFRVVSRATEIVESIGFGVLRRNS